MSRLALDERQRHALTGELDSLGVPQLVFVPTSSRSDCPCRVRYCKPQVDQATALEAVSESAGSVP